MRKRPMVFATIAVVLVGAAGATAVFLVGSKQRRDDKKAYLAYERAVLVPIVEGGRIVQQEIKPSLDQLRRGEIGDTDALARAGAWRRAFASARSEIVALDPPAFLGDIERRFAVAMAAYALVPDLFAQVTGASGPSRVRLIDAAAAAGRKADRLFDRAAEIMQFHRRRLGLGATNKLPNPGAPPAS